MVAALIGNPSRATMLTALLAGKALSAGELARVADVSPQTATGHLIRLQDASLLRVVRQGRHRYFELSGADVAALLESLLSLAGKVFPAVRTGPRDASMQRARVCYDHLPGEIAVNLYARLEATGSLVDDESGVTLSPHGIDVFQTIGIDFTGYRGGRMLCRSCLDWSARKPHLAGHAGAALLDRLQVLDLVRRVSGSRTVVVTAKGEASLAGMFRSGPALDGRFA
jgi:DNA-binding transcriptional ArsR family regulator